MTHPIHELMNISLSQIKEMIDVDKIVGNPIKLEDGSLVLPISKVGFGFGSGGSEFGNENRATDNHPFGGGSAAGVTLNPVAFIVVSGGKVELLHIDQKTHIIEKLVDLITEKLNNDSK